MSTSFTRITHIEKPDIHKIVIEKWTSLNYEDKLIEEKNIEWNEFINDLREDKLLTDKEANKYIKECIFK